MRMLVCGGREYNDREWVYAVLDRVHQRRPVTMLIEGEARGADTLAKEWAISRSVPFLPFPPDWAANGRRAGPIRNHRMLRDGRPDVVIAFPGGRGTAHMVQIAKDAGKRVVVIGSCPKSSPPEILADCYPQH